MYSHLSADTEEELVAFAKEVGLPLNWLQCSGSPTFHFDVTGSWLKKLISNSSVKKITLRAFGVRGLKKLNEHGRRLKSKRNS